MTCTNCGGPMIEGFTSRYCKNECDLKVKAAEDALDVKLPLTPPEWTKIRVTPGFTPPTGPADPAPLAVDQLVPKVDDK